MMTACRGYILFTTLLMMSIVSILVLSLMQAVYLDFKMSNQFIANHEAFYQLEKMGKNMMQTSHMDVSQPCVIRELDANQIDTTRLQRQGCKIEDDKQVFHYIISDLGLYPCLEIMVGETKYSSHHWLMSIMSDRLSKQLLQIRVALPEQAVVCESYTPHRTSSGIISWRVSGPFLTEPK